MERAEGVRETAGHDAVQPRALDRQEARLLLVGARHVDEAVGHVQVAHEDDGAALRAQGEDALQEGLVVAQLEIEPLQLAPGVGKVGREQREIAVVGLDDAALARVLGAVQPQPHGVGRAPREQQGAAVARLLARVPDGLVARLQPGLLRHLFGARLHLLQPRDVGRAFGQPRLEGARAQGRAQTVHVPRADAQRRHET